MTTKHLLAVAVALLATGCSAGQPSPEPSAVPTTPAPASPTASAPTPGTACPSGAYLVTTLEGRGAAASIGKATGGNVAADFTAGTFTLSSDGSAPLKSDIGPTSAEVRFDGRIVGTYSGDSPALRMTTTEAEGNIRVKGLGFTRTQPVDALADQLIGADATAQVTCDDAAGTALVVLPNASLTLTRQG